MMSAEDRETLYSLLINQLVYDGYGVFALSLKKILVPNCETVASNKLLKLVKLGLAVSKFLEDSNLKDPTQSAHSFRSGSQFDSSFFSTLNNAHNQQQQQQNGTSSESAAFIAGAAQAIKLEPGERDPNAFNFSFTTYPRPWAQIVNRSSINLDRDIHELPSGGSPTKLFECSLCGKVFNRRDKVKRHLSELHHGIKSYQCATCARAFSRNDKLVRHIMTVHQGIKAFGCSHCTRRFSRRWEYQRHMQVIHPNLLTLGKDVSKVSPVETPQSSDAHQVVDSQPSTASGTSKTDSCSTQEAPCNSTSSGQCTNSSDPPVTAPILPPAVANGVFSAFPMFNGGGTPPIGPTASTLSTIPFSTHSTSTSCPAQSLTFAPNVSYAGYMTPLMKSSSSDMSQSFSGTNN